MNSKKQVAGSRVANGRARPNRAEPEPPASFADDRKYQRTLLGIVMLAVTAFGSLMTLVTVALGEIGDELDASRATMTWAITGLVLTMAVMTPIAGSLGDVHGHRRMLLIGLVGGAGATFLCGIAWNAPSLIAFRVLFGLFAACVNPNAMSLMMHAYGPDQRATAVGWFQFAVTGAPTIGLIAGGPLIDAFGWRVIFFVFAGVSAVAFVFGLPVLRSIPRQQGRPVDVPGAVTLGIGVLAALLAITRIATTAQSGGLGAVVSDLQAIALVLLAIIGATSFVTVERRSASPMLKLEYFGRRNFTMPLMSSAAMQFAYMGGFVITPALLEERYGWMVGSIALLMMPRPGVFSIASPLGGWLPQRVGFRRPVILGALCMMASMGAFAFATPTTGGVGIAWIVVGLCLSGFAAGVSQPAIGALSVGAVDEADMGIANGMNQQMTFVGIVAGIQTMNVLIGDNASGARFAGTYMVGMGIAALGLLAAFAIETE